MPDIRISVANLVPRVVHMKTGEGHFMGLLNRKFYRKGQRIYGALGGAAELTLTGMRLLEARFNADFENGRDARLFINPADLDEVMKLFAEREPSFCETDPFREIQEELIIGEYRDLPPVLPNCMYPFKLRYVKSLVQASQAEQMSRPGGTTDIPSHRYFHLFEMFVPDGVFTQLQSHPAVKFFTKEEIATTQQGAVQGLAQDGSIIGTNLFW